MHAAHNSSSGAAGEVGAHATTVERMRYRPRYPWFTGSFLSYPYFPFHAYFHAATWENESFAGFSTLRAFIPLSIFTTSPLQPRFLPEHERTSSGFDDSNAMASPRRGFHGYGRKFDRGCANDYRGVEEFEGVILEVANVRRQEVVKQLSSHDCSNEFEGKHLA